MSTIAELDVPQTDRDKIFSGNALRILNSVNAAWWSVDQPKRSASGSRMDRDPDPSDRDHRPAENRRATVPSPLAEAFAHAVAMMG